MSEQETALVRVTALSARVDALEARLRRLETLLWVAVGSGLVNVLQGLL